jgi:hypothetical protein
MLKNELFTLTREQRRQRGKDDTVNLRISILQAHVAVAQIQYNEAAGESPFSLPRCSDPNDVLRLTC